MLKAGALARDADALRKRLDATEPSEASRYAAAQEALELMVACQTLWLEINAQVILALRCRESNKVAQCREIARTLASTQRNLSTTLRTLRERPAPTCGTRAFAMAGAA